MGWNWEDDAQPPNHGVVAVANPLEIQFCPPGLLSLPFRASFLTLEGSPPPSSGISSTLPGQFGKLLLLGLVAC